MKTFVRLNVLAAGLLLADFCFAQVPVISAVTSGAFLNNPAPGSLATIFGTGLSEGTYSADSLPLPFKLGSTTVSLCNPQNICTDAQLLFASPTQVNFYVPTDQSIDGNAVNYGYMYLETITVSTNGTATTYAAQFDPVAPSIFAVGWDCDTFGPDADTSHCGLSGAKQGEKQVERGAITDLSGKLITSENPARFGQYYVIYLTGINSNPAVQSVAPVYIAYPYVPVNDPNLKPTFGIDIPLYAGDSSYVGLQQINFQLDSGLFGNDNFVGIPYPPEWPCGTKLEAGISVQQGNGFNAYDNHTLYIPVVIAKGEIPCI